MARMADLPINKKLYEIDKKNLAIPIILNKSVSDDLRIKIANESYSEKIISITLLFTSTEPSGGVIFIILGGIISLGPPEGACIAAQDKKIKIQREWRNIESSFMLYLISIHINRKLFAEYHLICC